MAQGGGGKGDDVEFTLVMMIALFFVIVWGAWSIFKQPMMEGIRWIKLAELSVVQFVDPSLSEDVRLLQTLKNDQETIKQIKTQAEAAKKKIPVDTWLQGNMLAPEVLWNISNHAGEITRYPLILALLAGGIFFMAFSKKNKFRTPYDLEGLIRAQAQQWPVVTPIVDYDPAKHNSRNPGDPVPDVLPTFAEALAPEEWVAFHRIPVNNKVPDRDAMRRAFQQQLGPRWTGFNCLTPAQRCLMAAFALKGAQRRKEGDALLGRIAQCWHHKTGFTPGGELMSDVERFLADDKLGGAAARVAQRFAYRSSALIGVLKWARERGGVLAPAAFMWMRAHEREVWYPLNNLGRRTYHTEGAGAMAHYMAEKAAGKPLPVPRLETAVLSMVKYFAPEDRPIPVVPPREEAKPKKGKK